jgi:hypothetical protein
VVSFWSVIKWPAIFTRHRTDDQKIMKKNIVSISGPIPSTARIMKATLIAAAVATIILLTTVLPAEYGIDPLGTGAVSGLLDLSKAEATSDVPELATVTEAIPIAGGQSGTFTSQPKIYKVDSQDLFLLPGQGVEIKYHMEKDAVMVYSWKASDKLLFEFHGEPDEKPNKEYFDSYELDNEVGRSESYGSFTAPSTGIHGWFWENRSDKEVEIHLTAAGFFDAAKMFAGGPPEDLPIQDAK